MFNRWFEEWKYGNQDRNPRAKGQEKHREATRLQLATGRHLHQRPWQPRRDTKGSKREKPIFSPPLRKWNATNVGVDLFYFQRLFSDSLERYLRLEGALATAWRTEIKATIRIYMCVCEKWWRGKREDFALLWSSVSLFFYGQQN